MVLFRPKRRYFLPEMWPINMGNPPQNENPPNSEYGDRHTQEDVISCGSLRKYRGGGKSRLVRVTMIKNPYSIVDSKNSNFIRYILWSRRSQIFIDLGSKPPLRTEPFPRSKPKSESTNPRTAHSNQTYCILDLQVRPAVRVGSQGYEPSGLGESYLQLIFQLI